MPKSDDAAPVEGDAPKTDDAPKPKRTGKSAARLVSDDGVPASLQPGSTFKSRAAARKRG